MPEPRSIEAVMATIASLPRADQLLIGRALPRIVRLIRLGSPARISLVVLVEMRVAIRYRARARVLPWYDRERTVTRCTAVLLETVSYLQTMREHGLDGSLLSVLSIALDESPRFITEDMAVSMEHVFKSAARATRAYRLQEQARQHHSTRPSLSSLALEGTTMQEENSEDAGQQEDSTGGTVTKLQ